MNTREYPYEKRILLNAVYDVLDRLACPMGFSDSRAGILRFSHGTNTGEMDFTAILRDGSETTRVEISHTEQELSGVILDEIASVLHQSFEHVRRNAV